MILLLFHLQGCSLNPNLFKPLCRRLIHLLKLISNYCSILLTTQYLLIVISNYSSNFQKIVMNQVLEVVVVRSKYCIITVITGVHMCLCRYISGSRYILQCSDFSMSIDFSNRMPIDFLKIPSMQCKYGRITKSLGSILTYFLA